MGNGTARRGPVARQASPFLRWRGVGPSGETDNLNTAQDPIAYYGPLRRDPDAHNDTASAWRGHTKLRSKPSGHLPLARGCLRGSMLSVSMKDEGQPSSDGSFDEVMDRLHNPGPDEIELMTAALQRVRAMPPEDKEALTRDPAREVAQAVSLAESASTDSDLRAVASLWIEPLLD